MHDRDFSNWSSEAGPNNLIVVDPDPHDAENVDTAPSRVLRCSDAGSVGTRIPETVLTAAMHEPAELLKKRVFHKSAVQAAENAAKHEEAARDELRRLEAKRPKTGVARIAGWLTGRTAEFDVMYDEAKRVHEAAKKELSFRERHAQSLKVALACGEAAWEKEQRETNQESVSLVHENKPDLGIGPGGFMHDRNGQREEKSPSWPDLRNP